MDQNLLVVQIPRDRFQSSPISSNQGQSSNKHNQNKQSRRRFKAQTNSIKAKIMINSLTIRHNTLISTHTRTHIQKNQKRNSLIQFTRYGTIIRFRKQSKKRTTEPMAAIGLARNEKVVMAYWAYVILRRPLHFLSLEIADSTSPFLYIQIAQFSLPLSSLSLYSRFQFRRANWVLAILRREGFRRSEWRLNT